MVKKEQVLVVEDDATTRVLLARTLETEGFAVLEASTGEAMRMAMRRGDVSLVILDINLPDANGFDLARELRASPGVGILILTSRAEDVDRIVGLEIGADDYMTKPFNPRELAVRTRNLARRLKGPAMAPEDALVTGRKRVFKNWTLDLTKRRLVHADGSVTALTPGEFGLLATLVDRPGVGLTRDQLMDGMGGSETAVTDRSVDVLVGRVRRKLGDNPRTPDFILTMPGIGYMFAEAVRVE
ncbi:MAG: response regulator [Rhodospirillum sp.]|nr:response regulator [Rhodospirillum sp.]MCF8489996.1 response regulator [Rhodospirillum sp.]MCF8498831.1 response regulator [Rhodospirillum sp.]